MSVDLPTMSPTELALWILASRGAACYAAYLMDADDVRATMNELCEELPALEPELTVEALAPSSVAELLQHLPSYKAEALLIDASRLEDPDLRLLDRRRSELSKEGSVVFFMTHPSFDGLMRAAPNLASWLGGMVFEKASQSPDPEGARETRLTALRAWSGKTDHEVIQEAVEGALPRDPEYAEWLVLLGRGDLLHA